MATTGELLTAEVPATEGIVRALEDAGIGGVFGIIGGSMGRLYDARYGHQATIRAVLSAQRHLAGQRAGRGAHVPSRSQPPGTVTGTGCRGTRTRIRPPTRNSRAMLSTPMLESPVSWANTPTSNGPRMAANLPNML